MCPISGNDLVVLGGIIIPRQVFLNIENLKLSQSPGPDESIQLNSTVFFLSLKKQSQYLREVEVIDDSIWLSNITFFNKFSNI